VSDPKGTALHGLMTAILTPFDAEGRLALELMPTLLDFQRKAGVDGVVVCGTNGEGTSLSVEERKQILEAVMENREGLTVVAGTGATSLTDALALSRHAEEVGADALLVLPPFFVKNPSAEGLATYFGPILEATSLPTLLYSIPQFTAVPISNELLERLADYSNLAGLKDSAGDWTRTHALITRFPHLRVFAGSDRLAAACYTAGGAGCISGGANAFPEIVAAVRDAHLANPKGASVETAQARLDALIDITIRYPFISSTKAILPYRGLPRLGVRPPLVTLPQAQEESLIAELRAAGFLT
jgi:4-hydroxy-tetrahydrodipicolinate synthase